MGASSSKIEEGKALRLCRERKKFIRQALNGRCSLAATHVAYIQSLRIAGTALRKFFEPEAPRESSLYTSTSATPEPVALTEKSLSQFALSSPSFSQRVDAAENSSPPPSPPTSTRYHTNYMKFRGSYSKMVEEKPSVPIAELVTPSGPPRDTIPSSVERHATSSTFDAPSVQAGTPPWDYFGLLHPIDNHFSPQEGRGSNQGLKNADDMHRLGEEEGIPELEDEASVSSSATEQSQESEDEFDDEPSVDTLVRSFENVNRAADKYAATATPGMPSAERETSDTEFLNGEKSNSPDLSPLRATSSRFVLPNDVKTTPAKENGHQSEVSHKDFLTTMKDIESLFVKASDSGREVPRMLEANKRPATLSIPLLEKVSTVIYSEEDF
ncbi:hypothetical protein RJ640_016296 [Escallonia rubra]|uniref:Uncharacterized protein n=1 Tax=Escallonia rubra TaxID=112253 RepID=A0AA88R2U0_9ASTE|nr:hypothetical protein RJ640_016296 [Escallonia rubra]